MVLGDGGLTAWIESVDVVETGGEARTEKSDARTSTEVINMNVIDRGKVVRWSDVQVSERVGLKELVTSSESTGPYRTGTRLLSVGCTSRSTCMHCTGTIEDNSLVQIL